MKVKVSEQVQQFFRSCPPEPRRWLREALRRLEKEEGDLKTLTKELSGYHRLRVRSYRIIFRYAQERGERVILCAFAEHRGIVYEAFSRLMED